MTRILSYNILAGGYNMRDHGTRRTQQLVKMIQAAQPDIVGLAEAVNPIMKGQPSVVEELAQALDMKLISGGELARCEDYQTALMTRLPVIYTKIHARPSSMARPLLEVCVEQTNGEPLIVFMTHLSAAFNRGRAGGHIRMREIAEILRLMAPVKEEGRPHLIMGDFNSLAPGELFQASILLRYVLKLDTRRNSKNPSDGHPHLDGVVPPRLRFLNPILKLVAKSDLLCSLFDTAAYFYAPRGCIRQLQNADYSDCFRQLHPDEKGFTCPAAAPAGRIDYIFADPVLAKRLQQCEVILGSDGLKGDEASDHLPVLAEFGIGVVKEQIKQAPSLVSSEVSDD